MGRRRRWEYNEKKRAEEDDRKGGEMVCRFLIKGIERERESWWMGKQDKYAGFGGKSARNTKLYTNLKKKSKKKERKRRRKGE